MTPSGATLILTTVATSCVAILLGMPRPIEPTDPPALVVTRAMQSRVDEADLALARGLHMSPELRRVASLVDASSRGEVRLEAFGTADARRRAMDAAVGAVLRAHGVEPLRALRARSVLDALVALDAGARALPEPERVRRLGRFTESLEQYDAYARGERRAPRAVVRVIYMARWNAIVGRLNTDGFTDEDLRMYWGWLALHATGAPIDLRIRALRHYGDLGGKNAAEAAGVLLFRVGEFRESSRAFDAVHAVNGSIRARNHGLAGVGLQ